jgi:uncharacterized protein YccT (UPF0319 family)
LFLKLSNPLARFIAITTILIIQPQQLLAATSVTISDNLVLKEVNDKALDVGFFSSKSNVDLPQGTHTLLVKYKDVFEDLDFAEERLVESDPFIIKFTLNNEKSLLLSTPEIKNLAAAEQFSHMPEIILADQKGKSLVLELVKYDDYKLANKVNLAVNYLVSEQATEKPINDKVSDLAVTSEQTSFDSSEVDAQAAVNTKTNEIETKVNLNQAFNKQVTNHIKTGPMLKYWWKKASDEEKQDFIRFIKSQ